MKSLIRGRAIGSILFLGLIGGIALLSKISDMFTPNQICYIASTSRTVSLTIEGKNIASSCGDLIYKNPYPELGLYLANDNPSGAGTVCTVGVDGVSVTVQDTDPNGLQGGFMCRWLNEAKTGNYSIPTTRPLSTATQFPTSLPLPTKPYVFFRPTATNSVTCLHWTDITPSMAGRQVCVYGTIVSLYNTSVSSTRIKFTSQPNTFFIDDVEYIYPELRIGDCVYTIDDIVMLYNNIPYITISKMSKLYYCESWMH